MIETDGGIDNLDYDAFDKKIHGASVYRLKDTLKVHQWDI